MAKLLHTAIWRISTQSFIYRICLLDIGFFRRREFDIKQLAFIILLVLNVGAVSTVSESVVSTSRRKL